MAGPATAARATAGGDPGYLAAADVLPGACFPEVVLYGQLVDCRFPLTRQADLDPWFGPHVADQDVEFDNENDDQADCIVEEMALLCRGLTAYYRLGDRTVRPIISGVTADATAAFDGVDWLDFGVQLSPFSGREPYVFEGGVLHLHVDSTIRTDVAFARITDRDGEAEVVTVALPPLRPNTFETAALDVSMLSPGRYRVTPCLGETATGCEPVPGGQVFQIGSAELLEVVPGWNRAGADRINIVFAGSGFDSVKEARAVARSLLTWEGGMALDWEGNGLPAGSAAAEIAVIEFGPFSIEPLASAKGLFNIWVLGDLVADPRAMVHSAPPFGFGPSLPEFGLPDVSVTALHLQPIGRFGRSEAGWTSFTSPDGPTVVTREGLQFAGAYLALPRTWALDEASTLAHEWGHALFDLRDEYVEGDRGVTHGYPNCAPDLVTAQSWWGALEGEIDPFVYTYVAALELYSVWVDPLLAERVEVRFETGGCYSDSDDAVRPTADSLMNSGIPVFGTVNRRRVEEILGLWSGRNFLSDPADLTVTCAPATTENPGASCAAEVAALVDVAPEGLLLTVGTGTTARCSQASGGGAEPATWSCPRLALLGSGPWQVSVGTPSGSVSVAALIASPQVPTTTTTTVTAEPTEPEPAPLAFPILPLVAGGSAILALVLVTLVRRSRDRGGD